MGKKEAELRVVFAQADGATKLIFSVNYERGELYSESHLSVLAGKYSYHASGEAHRDVKLIGNRTAYAKRTPLRSLKGCRYVTGFGGAAAKGDRDYIPKPDIKRRRTVVVRQPTGLWGVDLWAVERERGDLMKRIADTPPYPEAPYIATVASDWTDPWLLATVWAAPEGVFPYQVYQVWPAILGRVPIEKVPFRHEGTWLAQPDIEV